jgi:hypothetical protein
VIHAATETSSTDESGDINPLSMSEAGEGNGGRQLFDELVASTKKYLFLRNEWHYRLIALFIVQTYMTEILPSVFYLGFIGGKDTGKTTALEVVIAMSRDGILTGDASPAALARTLNDGCTLGVDELDDLPKELKIMVQGALRRGYRRGNCYLRWDIEENRAEVVNVFGPKCISFRSEIDDALRSRVFPIPMTCAHDISYALHNMARDVTDLKAKLEAFRKKALDATESVWRCVRCNAKFSDKPEDGCPRDLGGCGKSRSSTKFDFVPSMTRRKLSDFVDLESEDFHKQVREIAEGGGRSAELAGICLILGRMLGVDIRQEFREARKLGLMTEGEDMVTLQEVVAGMVKKEMEARKYKLIDEGKEIIRIRQKDVRVALNDALIADNESPVSSMRFSRMRRELGISDDLLVKVKGKLYWRLPLPVVTLLSLVTPTHMEEGYIGYEGVLGGRGEAEPGDQQVSGIEQPVLESPAASDKLFSGRPLIDVFNHVKSKLRCDKGRPDSWIARDTVKALQLPEDTGTAGVLTQFAAMVRGRMAE